MQFFFLNFFRIVAPFRLQGLHGHSTKIKAKRIFVLVRERRL